MPYKSEKTLRHTYAEQHIATLDAPAMAALWNKYDRYRNFLNGTLSPITPEMVNSLSKDQLSDFTDWLAYDDNIERFTDMRPVYMMMDNLEKLSDDEMIEKWNYFQEHEHDSADKIYRNDISNLNKLFSKKPDKITRATNHENYHHDDTFFYQETPNSETVISFSLLRGYQSDSRNPIDNQLLAEYLVNQPI